MNEPIIKIGDSWEVDVVFENRDAGMPILSNMNMTGEEVRQKFDRPDDLMVVENAPGMVAVIHKEGYKNLQRRKKVVDEILAEKGIDVTDDDSMNSLSIEDILELRSEIEKRLNQS